MIKFMLTKEKFEQYAPVCIDVEDDIFHNLSSYFDRAYRILTVDLLGEQLSKYFGDTSDFKDEVLDTPSYRIQPLHCNEMQELIYQYVANYGLFLAIPQLDLVLTNNGFGIVSTQQIAPASNERVERLKASCWDAKDQAFDLLLCALPGNSLTKEKYMSGAPFKRNTESYIWTEKNFLQLCHIPSLKMDRSNRDYLRSYYPIILQVEKKIANTISWEMWERIITSLRSGDTNELKTQHLLQIIDSWYAELFYCKALKQPFHSCQVHEDTILDFLDNNTEYFPEYEKSNQFAARHAERFVNQPQDRCFFF